LIIMPSNAAAGRFIVPVPPAAASNDADGNGNFDLKIGEQVFGNASG
jgi:hypothetical protein